MGDDRVSSVTELQNANQRTIEILFFVPPKSTPESDAKRKAPKVDEEKIFMATANALNKYAPRLSSLVVFSIADFGFLARYVTDIVRFLYNLPSPKLLRELDLSGNYFGNKLIADLAQLENLTSLEAIGFRQCALICPPLLNIVLWRCKALRVVNLSYNAIDVELLFPSKTFPNSVENIAFNECSMNQAQVKMLVRMICDNPDSHLKEINLVGNDITGMYTQ